MIPIKIQCGCGQKYVFDVEPVDGRMACAVACPVCGADGTAAADAAIANHQAPPVPPDLRLRLDRPRSSPQVFTPPTPVVDRQAALNHRTRPVARSKWLIPAIGVALVLVLALVGVVYAGHSLKLPSPGHNDPTVSEYPRTLALLNSWYVEPPAGQNGADYYTKGLNALQNGNGASGNGPRVAKETLPPPGTPVASAVKSSLTSFVRGNGEALRLFGEGAKFEQSRYPVDLTPGYAALLPHLSKLRSAGLVVEASAILHAEAHDGKAATEDVLVGLALARSLQAEPTLLSQLVRAGLVATAVDTWEQSVNRAASPQGQLSDLMNTFKKMEEYEARGEGSNRGLAGERATWIALLEEPSNLLEALSLPGVEIPADQREQTLARLNKGGPLKEQQQELDRIFDQLMRARKAPFPARLAADKVIQEQLAEAARKKTIVLGVLLPSLSGRSAKEAESLARLRLGLTAVALEQYHAAHNSRYPTDLTQLAPEYLPAPILDPFDGQPLRYRAKGSGYVLYSIGPDLRDDSGNRMSGREGDIVFAVVDHKLAKN
jgi:hypothetical protein